MVKKLIFIGHRGTRTKFDENTLVAFNKAIEYGVDYIEFDVRKTKDEKLVIMHDSSLERTTNGFGLLKDFNFTEISKLKTKSNQLHIPSLLDVLNKLKWKTKFMIDLKEKGLKDYIPKLAEEISIFNDVIFSARNLRDLEYIKANHYQSKVCYNITKGIGIRVQEFLKKCKNNELSFKPDLISLRSDLISDEFIKICHENQILTLTWDFLKYKDPLYQIKRLIKLGIDGILFDNYENILKIKNWIYSSSL
ncbi:MAG: glycerophosphodiester phosphodiesterase [Promethearchaeota archaeon]